MSEERFRPLFFPEYGYVLIILGTVWLADIVSGCGRRRLKVSSDAPMRLIDSLLFVAALAGIAAGVGLLRESAMISFSALGVFLLFGLPAMGMIYAYRRPDEGSTGTD